MEFDEVENGKKDEAERKRVDGATGESEEEGRREKEGEEQEGFATEDRRFARFWLKPKIDGGESRGEKKIAHELRLNSEAGGVGEAKHT